MAGGKTYRIAGLTTEEINWVFSQLADRLDQIEGLRGESRFQSDVISETKFVYEDSDGIVLHSIGE
jgi:hypothetical protein